MNRALLLILTCLMLPWSSSYAGGNGVGNGGGFALCANHQLYSYDYLLTANSSVFGRDVLVPSLQASLLRISSQLKRLRDPLAQQFDLYISLMYTQTPKAPYQWFPRQNLRLMYDPDLESALPKSCPLRKQAVYFTAPFMGVPYSSYAYDPSLIQLVSNQKNGALQVSYLWVHEWLWNYFDASDFMRLAVFNRLLHSEKLDTVSIEEYAKLRFGITKKRP
jgi:hypothetical protein